MSESLDLELQLKARLRLIELTARKYELVGALVNIYRYVHGLPISKGHPLRNLQYEVLRTGERALGEAMRDGQDRGIVRRHGQVNGKAKNLVNYPDAIGSRWGTAFVEAVQGSMLSTREEWEAKMDYARITGHWSVNYFRGARKSAVKQAPAAQDLIVNPREQMKMLSSGAIQLDGVFSALSKLGAINQLEEEDRQALLKSFKAHRASIGWIINRLKDDEREESS